MSRTKLVAGNWKMNCGPTETRSYFSELEKLLTQPLSCELCLAPPALSLPTAVECAREIEKKTGIKIAIAAQNAHGGVSGAFTGEISASMLRQAGVMISIVGHSERRTLFMESDSMISARAQGLLSQGISVIYCLGETLAERQSGSTEAVLTEQLKHVPWGSHAPELVLAYEPVWAIGTGVTATPQQAQEAHAFIRKLIPAGRAEQTRILYGGSVTPENASSLLSCPDVDGALVGGASLKPASFCQIARQTPA